MYNEGRLPPDLEAEKVGGILCVIVPEDKQILTVGHARVSSSDRKHLLESQSSRLWKYLSRNQRQSTTVLEVNVQMASVIYKSELNKMVAERLGISQAAAGDATSAFLDSIGLALSENGRVTLTGFGTFSVKDRAARKMRAIAGDNAGQMIDVPARKYVAFKAGNTLEQSVRNR